MGSQIPGSVPPQIIAVHPQTGQLIDPQTGQAVAPQSIEINPQTGQAVNKQTGQPVNIQPLNLGGTQPPPGDIANLGGTQQTPPPADSNTVTGAQQKPPSKGGFFSRIGNFFSNLFSPPKAALTPEQQKMKEYKTSQRNVINIYNQLRTLRASGTASAAQIQQLQQQLHSALEAHRPLRAQMHGRAQA